MTRTHYQLLKSDCRGVLPIDPNMIIYAELAKIGAIASSVLGSLICLYKKGVTA